MFLKTGRKQTSLLSARRGKKEDPGNYRLGSLPSLPGTVMEQLVLDTISKHVKDRR